LEGDAANFSVTATANGTGALLYQWKRNGVAIVGATLANYTLASVSLADNGALFSVDVLGAGGTVSSIAVTLQVQSAAPRIVTAPTPQSVAAGQVVQFSVTAAGAAPLTYQWLKNGAAISGANASSYSAQISKDDNGSAYSVTITNSHGHITTPAATLTVLPSLLTDLVISEVSTCYYNNIDCWFEIYNPTSSSINLTNYTVRVSAVDLNSNYTTLQQFVLPSLNLAADGYVLLSGNASNRTQVGTQNIKLRSGSTVPWWSDSGFVELLRNGQTVDFVAFGASSQLPTSAGQWTGSNVSAMPYSATDYGRSIVRLYPRTTDTNTRSASDWTLVNWVTPAGRNDVPASALDTDGDGIPDSAEVSGGTYAGLDLYAWGAKVGVKDIFIEVDQMSSTDVGIIPRQEALQKVVDAFAAQGIAIHLDAGNLYSPNVSPSLFNLGQAQNLVTYEPCVTLDQTTCMFNTSYRRSVYDWKEENMDLRRRGVFHYALFGNSLNANGSRGHSGLAEIEGNDLMVTLGSRVLSIASSAALNQTINYQAGALMHELGHNLGLRHGGFEDLNYKPNYWSVMNYLYNLDGLDPDAQAITAYQRWRLSQADGQPAECSLVGSPCGSTAQFVISYSNGSSANLNESALSEADNIGRGAHAGVYADWDLNGRLTTTPISKDLNGDGLLGTLMDYNDWANLVFPFARYNSGNSGTWLNTAPTTRVQNPISDDRQPAALETDPMPRR
jgi:hypothetical protein